MLDDLRRKCAATIMPTALARMTRVRATHTTARCRERVGSENDSCSSDLVDVSDGGPCEDMRKVRTLQLDSEMFQ